MTKVAIVTGAARGIGAGVAAGLAAKGYAVALVGLEGDLLRQNAKAIGEKAIAFEADMTDRSRSAVRSKASAKNSGGSMWWCRMPVFRTSICSPPCRQSISAV